MTGEASDQQVVVTLRGLGPMGSTESVADAAGASPLPPVERAALINRYSRVLSVLETASEETDDDVLFTAQDRQASLVQSHIAEHATDFAELETGGKEVKFGDDPREDPLGWIKSLFDWVDRQHAHPIVRPSSTQPTPLPSRCRIAMTADWATGMYGAPASAAWIAGHGGWDLLVHLGDVYYSGTKRETKQRFADLWPRRAGTVNRAVNGNHEMYSGGFGYFQDTLPSFDQEASAFALANDDWLLIGLDAAWVDHEVDAVQAGWVKKVIADHGHGRKVVLFSHQQPFSRLGKQGPRIVSPLRDLLEDRAITAWYWGHEHDCIVYDEHDLYGLHGRCLGNGGIPTNRRRDVRAAPVHQTVGEITWRRLDGNDQAPSCLVLDGPNRWIPKRQEKFVPHGFMTLELRGSSLIERVHLPDGTELFANELG